MVIETLSYFFSGDLLAAALRYRNSHPNPPSIVQLSAGLVIGYWLFVVCYWLFVVCYWLFVVCSF
ncbi:hypothetical protein NJ959_11490 [Symplocastrum sp. BBK-W-15]|uniref:Uncharacterized protein n=1 Tax=Limnofasciculus baicalensis BBK-W-15 TaxID=2699891 RepID=A0AAE3GQY2_9CYAN|nr:hypothetical protein [Limnofasciculus baicalensis BBK-W-15]